MPRVLVLAPGGPEGIAAVLASGRAGALGLLDLCPASSEGVARRAIRELGRWADRPFGVVVPAGGMVPDWPDRLAVVVCRGGSGADWGSVVGGIRGRGRVALAEVATRQAASAAMASGADGVIVSGLEAGGRCGEESSFVLLQAVLGGEETAAPVWVRGGIGPRSASACVAAGAAGVVLDGAVLLARESSLGEADRDRVARLDGGEPVLIGPEGGPTARVDAPPGSACLGRLREAAGVGGEDWIRAEAEGVGWGPGQARPIGQDAAFAATLAGRFVTIGGIVRAVEEAIDEGLRLARSIRPLAAGSPMAGALGTRYPIVQGPMTRVSDSPAFARAVAEGGALPMLALAMLRGDEAAGLLSETASSLGGRPWGVGLLGFVDPSIRAGQLEAIRGVRPPFALIAGGRPDQAEELERIGIRTFLHAPSPGLLGQYLRDGARRFVLEGRECGGHVGPRSSLVLWEQAAGEVLGAIESGRVADPGSLHLLFAGGIHDGRSAAAAAALAAPLADRGVKIGVLVGTAYLFTSEAVETGAITPRFQREAVGCRETVLLRTGPGHEVRAVPSPFTAHFEAERARLAGAGASPEEIREALERLNVGRLRVASKGVDRAGEALEPLEEGQQYERGLYMIGQVATLRDGVTTIADLHEQICSASLGRLEGGPGAEADADADAPGASPADVAIVGMSAIFPGAADLRAFWENTLKGVDAIVEIPPDRWDWRPYYDPDPRAPDRVISRWGGFVPDIPFDPLRYGMPPSSLPSIEPAQLLVLEAVRAAIDDAGYATRPFPRDRTAVVLGMGGGAAQLAMGYAFRSYLPMLESVAPQAGREARAAAEPLLPAWTEDAFPGFLLNVTAGRVANRFDLGGANYTVDAACGSSLAAASLAVRELESGAADVVILGGADTVQNPFTYLAFSKTQAFSPRGKSRPFDASADGIVISEGVGVVVLKRLADAERDGDRIYAVIKGIGSSSDGRARGLTAPSGAGQARALARAYERAGVPPGSVGYVEAHGTGTAVGDVVEVNALAGFLRAHGAAPGSCVVGSVKSMIGHTKCAAGLAGLINASLALHHRTLPPTIGVERLNPEADLRDGPLRVVSKAQPWLHPGGGPRRAGVSAFGFGGTNFHAVLESYEGDPSPRPDSMQEWPAELLAWQAEDRSALLDGIDRLIAAIDAGARPRLRDLSHSLLSRHDPDLPDRPTLAVVAGSVEELRSRLGLAREAIARGEERIDDPRGVFFSGRPRFRGGGVALLFPGQGAQRLEMLGDLAIAFEEVRDGYESFDRALLAVGGRPVGPMVFPPTTLDEAARERARFALMATDAAQPAVGAASVGMLDLLRSLGIAPSAVAGHSFGELVALHAAGAMDVDAIARLSEARGRLMAAAAGAEPGTMAALLCDAGRASGVISGIEGVVVANLNGPRQTVLSGNRDALNRAIDRARGRGIRCFDLPVGGAFHSPIVAEASGPMAVEALRAIGSPPSIPVYSNLDAAPHPGDPAEIARRLGGHLASPVRFGAMIESMYESGVRCFIECGPGAALGPMVGAILGDRPHLAVSTDAPGRPGIPTLLTALGRLIASGIPVRRLSRLTGRRGGQRLDPDRMPTAPAQPPPSTWLVNGSRARPVGGPEPRRLGMAPELIGGPGPGAREDGLGHAGSNGHRASESIADGLARRSGCPGGGEMPPIGTEEGDELPGIRGNAAMNRRGVDRPAPCDPELVSGSRSRQISEGRMQIPAIPVDSRRSPERNGHPAPERNGHDPGPGPGPSSAAPRSGPHGDSHPDRVMEAFQETMRAFLEVQRSTMQAYLSGRGAGEARPGDLPGRSGGEVDSAAGVDGRVDRAPAGDNISEYADAFEGDRARLPATLPLPESGPKRAQAPAAAMGEHASISGRAAERPEFDGRIEVGEPTRDQDSSHGRPGGRPAGRVAERLLEIVRDRTGYPAEMLGMSLDLEADLGIDSIKRVEILGKLRDSIEGMAVVSGSGLMDRLSRSRTLGEIVSQVETALEVGAGPPTASPSDDGGGAGRLPASGGRPADKASGRSLRRMTLRAVDAPMAGVGPGLAPGGAVVLTDDGRGVADALAAALGREGLAVRVARAGWADPTSPSSVSAWLDRARGDAPLAGIIHAQPLGEVRGPGLDPTMWSDRLDHSLRGLFHLARAAAGDLERSSRRGGACVIAATSMGGAFGSIGGLGDGTFPGDGAIGGLIKTLAREWPTVRTRVVDLDPAESDRTIAGRLAIEAMRDDGWSEVGYLAGRRIRLGAVERPLDTAESDLEIKEGEPILITGGARGITASVAVELARRWRPTLLLVGSSPMPPESEGTETARLAPGSDLKAAVLREARGASGEVSPAELERAYRALLRSREIRATIGRIRDAGARVEYASVDVRDASALAGVLEGWRRRFGEPVGLIHGAGIIQDRLLREKTPESFDAVFGTKVEGALNLVRLIRGDALRFTALFSSVSGRFGNEGQSDYSAANEALNKLALRLDRQWPGRVVSLNWGPWAGVGMVADLEGHLGRRGLGMIDPATGCAALVDELRFGRKGDVEVILAGELGDLEAAPRAPIRTPEGAAR